MKQYSDAGFALTRQMELLELKPYLDEAGVPTIGYGTTVYPTGRHVTMKDRPISQDEAEDFLHNDVANTVAAVNAMVPGDLTQNQFDALVDFAYNVGSPALHGSTLLRLINVNPKGPLIETAFLMWNKVHVDGVLKPSEGLTARRRKEFALYNS